MAELWNSVTGVLGDGVSGVLNDILYATVFKLLYYAEAGLCWLVKMVYAMFEVVAGITQVSYNGKQMFLINVFFSDDTISKVYWGMAILGMALCFGFAIVAVIRKTFDIGDKIKSSYGSILTQLGKSILIMCSMSLIMSMILYSTNILMQQVMYIFNSSQVDTGETHISYDETDYAAMARIFNTIGNYSLSSSYQSRYNINSCYNDIRADLQYLSRRGKFDVYYNTKDMDGKTVITWQSALQNLVSAADPEKELPLDTYNESVSRALTAMMELLQTDGSFAPLESYDVSASRSGSNVNMDALMFLMGTLEAAKNPTYNENPSVTDNLRAAYYDGDKSIYDLDTVSQDFDIGLGATNYVLVGLITIIMLWNLVIIIFNCVARIYNMLLLYIIAPPVIAASPLDDGGKLKQWITAMVIQSLGVFGTVIAMRLLILFLPIILSAKLVLLDNVILNSVCKAMIVVASCYTVKKGSGMLTGILSDNAGFASARAADNSRAGGMFAAGAAATAISGAAKAGKMAMSPVRMAGYKAIAPIRRAVNGYRAYRGMVGGSGGSSGGFGGGYSGGANWMNQGGHSGSDNTGASQSSGIKSADSVSDGPQNLSSGESGSRSSIPTPPPMPMSNGTGKYVPTPPPMPMSNGAGKYVPTPPPMSGGSASGGAQPTGESGSASGSIPTPPPMPMSNGAGKYVPTPPPMNSGSASDGAQLTGETGSADSSIPTPPPMPTSNGAGQYVPTPPPMKQNILKPPPMPRNMNKK